MRRILMTALFVIVAGCTAIGQQKAATPEDSLRYAQAVLTGVYTTLGNSAATGTMPATDARKYFNRLEEPSKDLAAADGALRATGGTLPPDMIGRINLAVGVLTVIASELRARLPAAQTVALPSPR